MMRANRNSSIRANDSLAIKLNEIRLSKQHPKNKEKIFIIFEGKTDIKLFRKFFSIQHTDITAVNGKDNIEQALITLEKEGYNRIIGIRDADFSHIEKDYKNINNLFLTDHHDSEVMMINSPSLENIIHEFSSEKCHQKLQENLKKNILECAVSIAYLRWFNEKQKQSTGVHKLRFEGLNFNKFITVKQCELSINISDLIDEVIKHSKTQDLTKEDLLINMKQLELNSNDYLQICNGHDLTKLISLIFSRKENCNDSNINQKIIEHSLRLSFNIEYFKQTNLYKNLMDWANKQNYKII